MFYYFTKLLKHFKKLAFKHNVILIKLINITFQKQLNILFITLILYIYYSLNKLNI